MPKNNRHFGAHPPTPNLWLYRQLRHIHDEPARPAVLQIATALAAAAWSVVVDHIEAVDAGHRSPHTKPKLFNSLYVLSVNLDMPQHEVAGFVRSISKERTECPRPKSPRV